MADRGVISPSDRRRKTVTPARLLRPAVMEDLIVSYGGQPPTASDSTHLAEELLTAFGWRRPDKVRERPLAGCITNGGASPAVLSEDLTGNDLRIVLESFCKDIIDVVVAQLGYDHAEVWSVLAESCPDYRPSSSLKDWDEEVRRLTVGGATMVLLALAPLVFPNKASEVDVFAGALRKLSDLLNQLSHHHEVAFASSTALEPAPQLIRQLLSGAEGLLGELPWHMETSFVYGEQPKVLSGEAWSHGSPTRRLLRVISWAESSPGAHLTFWNKTRRNPVVTDPVFIVRPRRGQK